MTPPKPLNELGEKGPERTGEAHPRLAGELQIASQFLSCSCRETRLTSKSWSPGVPERGRYRRGFQQSAELAQRFCASPTSSLLPRPLSSPCSWCWPYLDRTWLFLRVTDGVRQQRSHRNATSPTPCAFVLWLRILSRNKG